MTRKQLSLDNIIDSSEPVRLFPGHAMSTEARVISSWLACGQAAPDYLYTLLDKVNIKMARRGKLCCFSEPAFYHRKSGQFHKLHGLIVSGTKAQLSTVGVYTSIGGRQISAEQADLLQDISKAYDIPILTVSNDMAIDFPVDRRGKPAAMYHIPWMRLITKTMQCMESLSAQETFLLQELLRYFQDTQSYILAPMAMGQTWSTVIQHVKSGTNLDDIAEKIKAAVLDWRHLTQYLAYRLSVLIGHRVVASSLENLQQQSEPPNAVMHFRKNRLLWDDFHIPNALPLQLCVDLNQDALIAGMHLAAPTDRKALPIVNWLLRQLSKCEDDHLQITAYWPDKAQNRVSLSTLRDDKSAILLPDQEQPSAFRLNKVWHVSDRIGHNRYIVEDAETLLADFYSEVGQHLKPWVPPATNIVNEVPVVKTIAKRRSKPVSQ